MSNCLLNNDCICELDKMVDNGIKVHLTVTSPPYYNARDYSHWDSYDDYLDWLMCVFRRIYNITEDGRMCCVNVSPVIEPRQNRNMESVRYPIPFDLTYLMRKIGWKFIEDIIWLKPEGSAPNRNGCFFRHRKPVAYKPNVVTEYILVFQKPMKGLIDKILRKTPTDILQKSLVGDDYERSNVWKINPETKIDHPAPFPLELPSKLIQYYSFVNDIVLDPFAGSGTTCLASKTLDRRYIGIEQNEKYFKLAQLRLKQK